MNTNVIATSRTQKFFFRKLVATYQLELARAVLAQMRGFAEISI